MLFHEEVLSVSGFWALLDQIFSFFFLICLSCFTGLKLRILAQGTPNVTSDKFRKFTLIRVTGLPLTISKFYSWTMEPSRSNSVENKH